MVRVNAEAYVPLLPYDLGYEQTVLQLIKSLDCLDKVVERVYDHVRHNINKQKSEIVKLNGRLNGVADRVQRLSHVTKSVQVYSSSKYPAADCHKDYEYRYDFDVRSDIVENIRVAHQICASRNPSDKLKFYNVDRDDDSLSRDERLVPIKGLGGLPDDVKYLNSLLLFNSNENLYKNYALFDPYKANATKTSKQVDCVENINKPVFTLPLNDTENQFNYSYTPVYEEVPSIDVPADLPDLPGIAGNVQCSKEMENVDDASAIFKPSTVVDLPSFDELDRLENDRVVTDSAELIVKDTIKPEAERSTSVLPTSNSIDFVEDIKPVKNEQNVNKMYDNVNTHSVLMDEIRNAGGLQKAKLRSVSSRKTTDETLHAGTGLISDLHKKLAMRRQGISGDKKPSEGLEGVIYQMSLKMLPPDPEPESEADGDDDTEGDWDD